MIDESQSRKRRKTSLFSAFALICVAADIAVADVDLAGAYRAALEKTEAVPLQQATARQADERYDQALGSIFPTVSLLGTYTRQHSPETGAGAVQAFVVPDQYNARLGLSQPLFRGFGEWAELASRRARAEAQKALTRGTRLTLYRAVADAYFGVLTAETDLVTLRALVDLTRKRISEISERVRIGRSRKGDLLSARSQAASLSAQVAAAEVAQRQARESFRFTTGLADDSRLAPEKSDPIIRLPSIEELERAIETRPDVEAARLELTASEETITVARAGHYPSLDLSANYYLTRTGVLANTRWDVGVTLSFPLFQGGIVLSQTEEAIQARKAAELALERTRRGARQELGALRAQLATIVDQLSALREASELAQANLDEQSRDYRLGLVTNLEVLQALDAYQDTRRSWDRTRYQAHATVAAFHAATGTVPGDK